MIRDITIYDIRRAYAPYRKMEEETGQDCSAIGSRVSLSDKKRISKEAIKCRNLN